MEWVAAAARIRTKTPDAYLPDLAGAKDTRTPAVTTQALRAWTYRMTVVGGCGVLRPAHGPVPTLQGKGGTDALVQARTVVAPTPLKEPSER